VLLNCISGGIGYVDGHVVENFSDESVSGPMCMKRAHF
jgi:hypothetical protein